jgi:cytochrome bd-type quinol oxidase subunit 2
MYIGMVLTLIAAGVYVVDQDAISQSVTGRYADYTPAQMDAARSFLTFYLLTIAAVGVVCWLVMIWAARKGKRWTTVTSTIIFALALLFALANFVIEEYGNRVVPVSMAIASLVPCVAGLIAVIYLWKDRKAAQ